MALTNAERQRRHYERQKAKAKTPGDATAGIQQTPFFKFFESDGNTDAFVIPLRLANITPPEFDDDSGAVFPSDLDGLDLPSPENSVERAELIIDCLLDAAAGLAGIVNRYKRTQIEAEDERLNEVGDQSTTEKRREILMRLVKLNRMLGELDKDVRRTLPQWKVKGV